MIFRIAWNWTWTPLILPCNVCLRVMNKVKENRETKQERLRGAKLLTGNVDSSPAAAILCV